MRQRISDRIHSDFLMRSRLARTRTGSLARCARVSSQPRRHVLAQPPRWQPRRRRHLLLAHDVDTDPATAAAMWAIERRLGIVSSYFFRLSTLDARLMGEIEAAGGGRATTTRVARSPSVGASAIATRHAGTSVRPRRHSRTTSADCRATTACVACGRLPTGTS